MRFPPWGDLLTAYNGTAISYDEIGNPDGYSDRTFTWEHGRQLASQTKGGVEWEYTYDTGGLRTKRSSDSKTYEYVYMGDKLVQMTITDHTTSPETVQFMEFSYDAAGQPLTMTLDGVLYYYVLNIQGDVMGMVDGDGNLLYTMVYEGYGAGYYFSGGSAAAAMLLGTNPLGYRGYVMDAGTGLYYLQSRYYDPALGRFINADGLVSTGQGLLGNNMFTYCLNNPVMYFDASGQTAEATIAAGTWVSSMWWLCFVDGLAIIGEAIYVGGIIILYVYALGSVIYHSVNTPKTEVDQNDNTETEKGEVISGNPPTEKDGYLAPKGGPKKGKTKDGKTGWVDKYGNIWVPAPTGSSAAHGGGHWDVQCWDGKGYINVYPGGATRPGGGKPPILPVVVQQLF